MIPCLEGLLPEPHNTTVLDLVYLIATWHALAKMSVHMDTSLRLLDTATTALGAGLRYFVGVTCPQFKTVETNAEYSKRCRQKKPGAPQKTPESMGRQPKTLSLKTIKLHFFGDYVACIKSLGATDSYTSGIVCFIFYSFIRCTEKRNTQGEHCHQWVKDMAQTRTNNRETDQQLGEMDYVRFQVNRIADKLRSIGVSVPGETLPPPPPVTEVPKETETTISTGGKSSTYLPQWLNSHRCDPVVMVTISLCQVIVTNVLTLQGFMDSLLAHLHDQLFPDKNSTEPIFIQNDTLYNCHWTVFLLVFFDHFQPNFTYILFPTFFPYVYSCYVHPF